MRHRMSSVLIALSVLSCTAIAVHAQISMQISLPGIDIGINMPMYPTFVQVPDYPVYYAEQADMNYFFYDGLYWVFSGDNWYASSWYNGPWDLVSPDDMPLFVLRVPVRYYRQPPAYFRDWRSDGPPRWGEHWGHDWQTRRSGWDQWDHNSAPDPAPLPIYQRQYSGQSYPSEADQQMSIRSQNYRYEPREAVTRQHYAEPPNQVQQNSPAQQRQVQQRGSAPPDQVQPNSPARTRQVQQKRPAPPDRVQHNSPASSNQVQKKPTAPAQQVQQDRPASPNQVHPKKVAPGDQVQQKRPAPQSEVQQKKSNPQDKTHQKKPDPQNKDRQDKNSKGGQGNG